MELLERQRCLADLAEWLAGDHDRVIREMQPADGKHRQPSSDTSLAATMPKPCQSMSLLNQPANAIVVLFSVGERTSVAH